MTQEQNRKEINKVLAKPLAITAGIIGLLQGIVWTILAVLSICCYYNSIVIELPTSTTSFEYYQYIYAIFLYDSDTTNTYNLTITPPEFSIFAWFYIFCSAIWACLSGTTIWAMIHNQWHLTKTLFGSWAIITFIVSIVDVILTGLIIGDYVKIQDIELPQIPVTYGIMMTIAARGFLLLVINLVFAVIMSKYAIEIILKGNGDNHLPIIHGYESDGTTNPTWFQDDVKTFWGSPHNNDETATAYDNRAFERSQSFFNLPTTNENIYIPPSTSTFYNTPVSNNTLPQTDNTTKPTTFTEAIINKTATIGRNKGRRSPPNNIKPPFIPDPDYTPPNSPNQLRSVLRTNSKYNY